MYSHIVLYGPVWSRMVLYDPIWSRIVLFGPIWSLYVSEMSLNAPKNEVRLKYNEFYLFLRLFYYAHNPYLPSKTDFKSHFPFKNMTFLLFYFMFYIDNYLRVFLCEWRGSLHGFKPALKWHTPCLVTFLIPGSGNMNNCLLSKNSWKSLMLIKINDIQILCLYVCLTRIFCHC